MESTVVPEGAIPQDVLDMPAGPDNNGFIFMDTVWMHVVGSDGECYTRKNGVVSISPEDEGDEDES